MFGLGDRSYGENNYNMCARRVRQRLLMLGVREGIEITLGDEQENVGSWGTYLGSK